MKSEINVRTIKFIHERVSVRTMKLVHERLHVRTIKFTEKRTVANVRTTNLIH